MVLATQSFGRCVLYRYADFPGPDQQETWKTVPTEAAGSDGPRHHTVLLDPDAGC